MSKLSFTKKYATYPECKDSGVEWLGDIPGDWNFKKFKGVFSLSHERVEDDPSVEQILSVSGYRGIEKKDVSTNEGQMPSDDVSQYRVVRPGQLVVNTMWLNYTGLGISEYTGFVSPAYRSYKPSTEIDKRFAHHIMRSNVYVQKYSSLLYGIRPNSLQVKPKDFEAIEILLPPKVEQERIARFLDEQTARIDETIAKKQKLIDLLKEKRTATINHAVTKGLDPHAELVDSGIDWIGKIPKGWDVKKVKHIGYFKSGEGITSEMIHPEGKYPVYGGNGLRGFYDQYTHNGDHILVGRQGALCGNINYAHGKFWASEHAVVVSLIGDTEMYWFGELLRSMNLGQYSVSAAQPGLAVDKVKNFFVPVPPLEEQRKMSEFLNKQEKDFTYVISVTQKSIIYLQELKFSLISHAVTGKIKV